MTSEVRVSSAVGTSLFGVDVRAVVLDSASVVAPAGLAISEELTVAEVEVEVEGEDLAEAPISMWPRSTTMQITQSVPNVHRVLDPCGAVSCVVGTDSTVVVAVGADVVAEDSDVAVVVSDSALDVVDVVDAVSVFVVALGDSEDSVAGAAVSVARVGCVSPSGFETGGTAVSVRELVSTALGDSSASATRGEMTSSRASGSGDASGVIGGATASRPGSTGTEAAGAMGGSIGTDGVPGDADERSPSPTLGLDSPEELSESLSLADVDESESELDVSVAEVSDDSDGSEADDRPLGSLSPVDSAFSLVVAAGGTGS